MLRPGMNRNGRELNNSFTQVQHIVLEGLAEEGLVLKMVWCGIYFRFSGFQPHSYLFTSATIRIPVHTATKSGTGTYQMRDD